MIKINLLTERKPVKAKQASSFKLEGVGGSQNLLLGGILILGFLVAGGWAWSRQATIKDLQAQHVKADAELQRLVEIRKKGDLYKQQKELLERKINLITDLKKKQSVPVHILDQISRNLADFLWLESMAVAGSKITITGKATTYTAVSNFYNNLNASGWFDEVVMGKAAEVKEGVSFSLTCKFKPPQAAPEAGAEAAAQQASQNPAPVQPRG
jgi:Tfp pilus assembly protein PilN